MGCDGGTIPKRDELVRQKKKAEVKDKDAANMAKWRYCALKHDLLKRPIVTDSHGLLYNKDALLEYLLDREQFKHGPTHIKKLKDIKELQLTDNPAFKQNHSDLANEYLDVNAAPFICPLNGVEMNGKHKFCVIWSCGCAISDRALRALNNTSDTKVSCPKCGQEYSTNDDVIVLNPENEDLEMMEQRRERLVSSQKKTASTKRKSSEIKTETHGKKIKTEPDVSSNSTASSSATVEKPATTQTHGSKLATVKKLNSSEASSSSSSTIQKDPTKSDVFKSLFTSSAAAKEKEKNKAHWITYNPLYF